MKRSMMKLGVFVVMTAIVMFTLVATASADDQKYRKTLHGEYAFIGSGACNLAGNGFDNLTPNEGPGWMGPNFWEGVYTFNRNGTGKMVAQQCYHDGPSAPVPFSSGCADLSWEFYYEICGGEITFTFKPGSNSLAYTVGPNVGVLPPIPIPTNTTSLTVFEQPWTGRISPDGKNLNVFYGGPFLIRIPEFGD